MIVKKKRLGLIGKDISYSFSKAYFSEKFETEGILDFEYVNFDIQEISEVLKVFEIPNLIGSNVTIPYKESIIPFLDKLDSVASEIGAVNTIKLGNGKKIGYNTDYIGFRDSILEFITENHRKALILGTGGASKAIFYALDQMRIVYTVVSRLPEEGKSISYNQLTEEIIRNHQIIINTTPLGTHPNVTECPDIPYEYLTSDHLVYDLIYNPRETLFLKKSKEKGALTINGSKMLVLQAEEAWKIWNN